MQSRVHRVIDERLVPDQEYKNGTTGPPGTPSIWMADLPWPRERRYKVGDVVKCQNAFDKIEYTYIVKDVKDGWFKLEWPD